MCRTSLRTADKLFATACNCVGCVQAQTLLHSTMDESKASGGDPRLRAKIREAFDLFDKEKHGTVIQECVPTPR